MSNDCPHLTYFDGRGRAEFIRLMLAAAGVEWKETHLKESDDIEKLRKDGTLLYQQVPLLQWHGCNMVQTGPIVRQIARKFNLAGKSGEEFQVDMLTEGARDLCGPLLGIGFGDNEKTKQELRERTLPRYMPVFEKILSNSKSGFLVGDGLTIADVSLLEGLLLLEEFLPGGFDGYPKCKEYLTKLKNQPRLAAYLNGPKRHGPSNPTYIAEVRKVLKW